MTGMSVAPGSIRRYWALLTMALAAVILAPSALAQRAAPRSEADLKYSFAPIVKQAAPAVVNVYVRSTRQVINSPFFNDPFFRDFFGPRFGVPRNRTQSSLGSGVIVSENGLVVTNTHVIKSRGRAKIRVLLADRREFDARIISKDEKTDIAILQLLANDEKFPFLSFEDSDALEVGDIVLAIGNPFGVGQTVTSGIVSALARTGVGKSDAQVFIQTDAAINPGNSGGALVDVNGRLVGINTAIYSRTGGSHGIGFAIPSNLVRLYVNSAITGQDIQRPWFGGQLAGVTREIAEELGLKRVAGAVVESLHPSGPAARAGLKIGDVIVAIDGRAIADARAALYRLTTRGVGKRAELEVIRRSRRLRLSIALRAAPKPGPDDIRSLSGNHPLDGTKVANLVPSIVEELKLDLRVDEGVVILSVRPGSVAASIGFRTGDVLVQLGASKIGNIRDLERSLRRRPRSWFLAIRRGNRLLRVEIPG